MPVQVNVNVLDVECAMRTSDTITASERPSNDFGPSPVHSAGPPSDSQGSPLPPTSDSSSSPPTKSSRPGPSSSRRASSSKAGAGSEAKPPRRRNRPKIALDPSQPLTAEGKPRARVYVACEQCRTRKTRCDGAQPVCFNCRKRPPEVGQCSYPKRRGQDKQPVMRVLPSATGRPAKRKRLCSGHEDEDVTSESDSAARTDSHSPGQDESQSLSHLAPGTCLGSSSDAEDSAEEYDPFPLVDLDAGAEVSFIPMREEVSIPAIPSLQFTRDTWWDALLTYYFTDETSTNTDMVVLTSEQRASTMERVVEDLRALFHSSLYWVSFINLPRFFRTLLNSSTRGGMQPSLVLIALAVGKLTQSSEAEQGARGRAKAMKLMEFADGALQASLASGWVDIGLVQAAWLIVYFQLQSNPNECIDRGRSSLLLLDSLIRLFSLTTLDADLMYVRTPLYTPASSPPVNPTIPEPAVCSSSVEPTSKGLSQLPGIFGLSRPLAPHGIAPQPSIPLYPTGSTCNCQALSLGQNSPSICDMAPAFAGTLIWPENVSEGEFRKEECRRLVWASVMVSASLNSYTAVLEDIERDCLWIKDPSNYALLFPVEALAMHGAPVQPNNVWSLYLRSMLLLHACVRKRADTTITEAERAQFAMNAWLEIDALEDALGQHTCELESSLGFQAREMIFSARMCVSHEFQKYIPQVTTNGRLFYRDKAVSWLQLRMTLAERLWQDLPYAIHPPALDYRKPLSIYWFMSHVVKALVLWRADPTLTIALEASKKLVKLVEYWMMYWPSARQRCEWQNLRYELVKACLKSGVPPPEPTLPARVPRAPVGKAAGH